MAREARLPPRPCTRSTGRPTTPRRGHRATTPSGAPSNPVYVLWTAAAPRLEKSNGQTELALKMSVCCFNAHWVFLLFLFVFHCVLMGCVIVCVCWSLTGPSTVSALVEVVGCGPQSAGFLREAGLAAPGWEANGHIYTACVASRGQMCSSCRCSHRKRSARYLPAHSQSSTDGRAASSRGRPLDAGYYLGEDETTQMIL